MSIKFIYWYKKKTRMLLTVNVCYAVLYNTYTTCYEIVQLTVVYVCCWWCFFFISLCSNLALIHFNMDDICTSLHFAHKRTGERITDQSDRTYEFYKSGWMRDERWNDSEVVYKMPTLFSDKLQIFSYVVKIDCPYTGR